MDMLLQVVLLRSYSKGRSVKGRQIDKASIDTHA